MVKERKIAGTHKASPESRRSSPRRLGLFTNLPNEPERGTGVTIRTGEKKRVGRKQLLLTVGAEGRIMSKEARWITALEKECRWPWEREKKWPLPGSVLNGGP